MLRQEITAAGGTIAFERTVTYQGFEDAIKLAAIDTRRESPDAVYVVLNYAGIDRYLKEIQGMEKQPAVLMTHTLLEAARFGNDKDRYQHAFGIYQTLSDPAFVTRYEKRWGAPPVGYGANGYDAALCLARAVAAGALPPAAGKTFECKGVSGVNTFSSKTRELVSTTASVMRVVDNKLMPAANNP